MSKVAYSSFSPYYETPQTSWYMGTWKSVDIVPAYSDKLVRISSKYKNRPDLLAYDEYNTVELWWVFSSRNPDTLIDPVFDMVEGTLIYIPTLEHIKSVLGG